MNPEICKKVCSKTKGIETSLIRFTNTDGTFVPYIVEEHGSLFKWLCEFEKVPKLEREITKYDIHVKKECPYWMEHELHDVNKK